MCLVSKRVIDSLEKAYAGKGAFPIAEGKNNCPMQKMKEYNNVRVGSEAQYDPRATGEILNFYPTTELDVDLKLMTHEPGRMPVGAYLDGVITHDDDDHFTFIENDPEKKKVVVTQRNPHVYLGKRINVNRKDDGTLYPTFNRPRYTKDFSFQDLCREAAEELLVVAGLIEEKDSQE